MYGDPAAIRRLAASVREQAVDVRREADQLVAAGDAVAWQSTAADRMRLRVRDRAADLRASATDLDDAAQRLDEHAAAVEHLVHLIASIEKKVTGLVEGAVGRLESAGKSLLHGAEHLVGLGGGGDRDEDARLASLTLPPPGDKAWLDVPNSVPGLKVG